MIPFISRLRRERDEARRYARKVHYLLKSRSERTAKGNETRKNRHRAIVIAKANEMRRAMNMPEIAL